MLIVLVAFFFFEILHRVNKLLEFFPSMEVDLRENLKIF